MTSCGTPRSLAEVSRAARTDLDVTEVREQSLLPVSPFLRTGSSTACLRYRRRNGDLAPRLWPIAFSARRRSDIGNRRWNVDWPGSRPVGLRMIDPVRGGPWPVPGSSQSRLRRRRCCEQESVLALERAEVKIRPRHGHDALQGARAGIAPLETAIDDAENRLSLALPGTSRDQLIHRQSRRGPDRQSIS